MKNRISDLELLDVYREHYRVQLTMGWINMVFGLGVIFLVWFVYKPTPISMNILVSILSIILMVGGILSIREARKKLGK